MRSILLVALLLICNFCFGKSIENQKVVIYPIHHASFVIQYNDIYIYVDPAGDAEKFEAFPDPNLILITHTHGDHFDSNLISKLKTDNTTVIGSKAAIDLLHFGVVLMNGENTVSKGIKVEAIPMYNTTPERLQSHVKGVGNGYVLTIADERIYISGDTEDIYEMRSLKNIDHAFVCMNLPFTMTPEQAASAVLDFKPKKVYPYHYSEKKGFSNIELFKALVAKNKDIEVIFLEWYDKSLQKN